MQKQTVLYIIIALLLGFISGFMLANSLNRDGSSAVVGNTVGTGSQASQLNPSEPVLSDEEIRAKVAEADQHAGNFSFQKDLGLALYRYGAMRQDANVLEQSRRLLERASLLNPKDIDVLVGLGHAQFDVGFYRKEAASFEKARETYRKALEIKPDDPDVQTDIGISYFVQEPPDYARAEAELKKVEAISPTHQRSLQFLVQVHVRQKRLKDAKAVLDRIRSINPGNAAISELSSQIAAAESGSQ